MPPKKPKITRSTASKKQRQEIDSLASVSSPPKSIKSKKSPKKQASLKSPKCKKGIIAQAVLETKQAKSSKDEKSSDDNENSTGSESALFVPQVKMAPFDVKLEHLLTNYFMAIGDQHDIRQAFIQNGILTFDLFMVCVPSNSLEICC